MLYTYNPGLIMVSFAGIIVHGYMDGTFVSVEYAEDTFSLMTGAGGDSTRVQNLNSNGSITLTLQQSSPVNSLLSAKALADRRFGAGIGPAMVKDLNGDTLCTAPFAWVRKPPTVEYGVDASAREWVLDCHKLEVLAGGAASLG